MFQDSNTNSEANMAGVQDVRGTCRVLEFGFLGVRGVGFQVLWVWLFRLESCEFRANPKP